MAFYLVTQLGTPKPTLNQGARYIRPLDEGLHPQASSPSYLNLTRVLAIHLLFLVSWFKPYKFLPAL